MKAVMETQERITLYYRAGSSDKVYQAAIEPAGELFVVHFAYGRRGATLTTGTKTSSPVAYDTAKQIFTRLVREKKAKGYTEGENGTPYQHTDKKASGILPQLLNPIEEAGVERLLHDDAYCAQEKCDGRRLLVRKQDGHSEGINKQGLLVGLPETVAGDLRNLPGGFISDGESMGDDYHVFDLLELKGENLRPLPYRTRLVRLVNLLLSSANHPHVRLVETAFATVDKLELWQRLRRDNHEGIVFKRWDAPYTPGKPNRGGAQLKFKFVASLSAVVARVNPRRSVEIGLFQGRSLVSCGNVTIPANHDLPQVGAVVEVRYLYAQRESHALYQPVYLGPRADVAAGECLASQLKYKAE
ncbi:MAG: WGR domain-containing protein [Verrucomicrobia bacterium]|nr:WGR domain-containing protein [Verrucomicrobiota bacterium]